MTNPGKRRWLVVLAFVLVVSFTGLFAVRTVRRAIYWHYHRDEPIRSWMSIGYIAHSYGVPPWVLRQALGLPARPPNGPDRRPIREIAREQNRPVTEVIATLENAIVHARPPYPPPGPPPPPETQELRPEPTQARSP